MLRFARVMFALWACSLWFSKNFFTEAIIETRKAARSKVAASLPWMGVFDGNFEKDTQDVPQTCFVGVV